MPTSVKAPLASQNPVGKPVRNQRAFDSSEHLVHRERYAAVRIPCFKLWQELIGKNSFRTSVGQLVFEAVANFDSGFVIIPKNGKQRPIVFPALPDSPFLENLVGPVVQIFALKTLENRDQHLLTGGMIVLDQKLLNGLCRLRRKNMRLVQNVISGRFRNGGRCRVCGQTSKQECKREC